jgi:quinol-cytochrome oxidoreductase complex cytochrome b subunit
MSPHELERNSDARAVPKRIALIRREAPARLLEDRDELVLSAPHLLVREIILFQVCVVVLAVISLLFDAPLEAIADPYHTPKVAKAPWYFLGLQELLHYFPPIVAGVILPALAVIAVVVIPYFQINLETTGFYERPWKRNLTIIAAMVAMVCAVLTVYRVWAVVVPTLVIFGAMALPAVPFCPHGLKRKLSRVPVADWVMTWFVTVVTVLTLIGILFRGPGWTWTWPWRDGIF